MALLTFLNILNFADRYLLISFSNVIISDLALSNFQFTVLTGLIFSIFQSTAGLFMGVLADRVHRPRLIATGLFVWSALTAATGAAISFAQLAVARALVGIGEATIGPAAVSLIAEAYPARRRAAAISVFFLAVPIGMSLSYFLAATMGAAVGWRNCFYFMGALGVVVSLSLFMLSDTKRSTTTHTAHPTLAEFLTFLRGSRQLWLLLGGAVMISAHFGTLVLNQVWLVKERGFTIVAAQQFDGTLFLLGGIVGALTAGWLSDAWQARRAGGRLLFLTTAYALAIPIALAYRFFTPHTAAFSVAAFLGSMSIMWLIGPALASLQAIVPERLRATGVAFFGLCTAVLGYVPGSLLVGYLADRFTADGMADPITWAFVVAGSPGLLAVPFFWAAYRYERVDEVASRSNG